MSQKWREPHLVGWNRVKQIAKFCWRTSFLLPIQHYPQLLVLNLVWHFCEVGEDFEHCEVLFVDRNLCRWVVLVSRHSCRVHSVGYWTLWSLFVYSGLFIQRKIVAFVLDSIDLIFCGLPVFQNCLDMSSFALTDRILEQSSIAPHFRRTHLCRNNFDQEHHHQPNGESRNGLNRCANAMQSLCDDWENWGSSWDKGEFLLKAMHCLLMSLMDWGQ